MIELVPIGPFDDAASAPNLETLRDYTATFFGCQCRVRAPVHFEDVAEQARAGWESDQLQLCTSDIFDYLTKRENKPERDVLVQVAVTMADLYIIKDGVYEYKYECTYIYIYVVSE